MFKLGRKKAAFVMALILITSLLSACNSEEKSLAENLYSYKTSFVGDSSKVGNIVNKLPFPNDYAVNTIEIISGEEPYGLKIYFDSTAKDASIKDFDKDSAILFSLIDNLSYITYAYTINDKDISIGTIYKEEIDEITKQDFDMTTTEIGSNYDNFNILVEKYIENVE